ncbi:MAG: helix-turn-helix domain-containing protein [Pirellulaceae bacterium]
MFKTKNFALVIGRQLARNKRLRAAVEKEQLNGAIATLIYDARTEAKLTQKELAELVGTQQSVIARLEDADYGGHSLSMLARIAAAMGRRLTVSFDPVGAKRRK